MSEEKTITGKFRFDQEYQKTLMTLGTAWMFITLILTANAATVSLRLRAIVRG